MRFCDLQIMRPAPLLGLCCLCIQHRLHTYSHTQLTHSMHRFGGRVTDSASKRLLLGRLPPGHEPGGQLTLILVCRDPLSLLTSNLLLQTGDFPVHFMSALHVLCSGPPERKNTRWQVYTNVQSKEGRSTALNVCMGWCFRLAAGVS